MVALEPERLKSGASPPFIQRVEYLTWKPKNAGVPTEPENADRPPR
jgi:hypothetical protein